MNGSVTETAQFAVESSEELLPIIAHELNASLQSLLAQLQLLQRDLPDDPQIKERLQLIRQNIQRHGETIASLAAYSQRIPQLQPMHAETVAAQLLPLLKDDDQYYVQMAQGWLVAQLAIHEPEAVYNWFWNNTLKYNINGKAIQKICDSFRISDQWKEEFKKLRRLLKMRK